MSELKPYQAYSHRLHGACCDHPDLYGVWCSMKSRCETVNVSPYTIYYWIRTKGVTYAEQRLSEIA